MCKSKCKVPFGPVKPIYIHDNHFEYDDIHQRCHPSVAVSPKIMMRKPNEKVNEKKAKKKRKKKLN